jgi:hypothetical protein
LLAGTVDRKSGRLQTYVGYFVNIFANSVTVTGWVWTSVMPPVLCGFSLWESCPAGVTEQLLVLTVVLVEFEFEL